jgi:hypothetical protein
VHPELLMTLEVEEVFMVKRLLLQVIRYVWIQRNNSCKWQDKYFSSTWNSCGF